MEEEAGTVRWIFSRYLRVRFISEIARALDAKGVKPVHGMRWQTSVVRDMLMNSCYRGLAYYGRSRSVGRGTAAASGRQSRVVIEQSRADAVPFEIPAIVEREVFEAVQAKLAWASKQRRAPSHLAAGAILSGCVFCATCGQPMKTGTYKASKRRGWNGGHYYTCAVCPPPAKRTGPRQKLRAVVGREVDRRVRILLNGMVDAEDTKVFNGVLFTASWGLPAQKRLAMLQACGITVHVAADPLEVRLGFAGEAGSARVGAAVGVLCELAREWFMGGE